MIVCLFYLPCISDRGWQDDKLFMGCKNRDKNKADQIKLPIFKSFMRIFVEFFFVFPFIPRTFAPQNCNQSIKTIEKI